MTTASPEQLQQLFSDQSGRAISQFGEIAQQVSSISDEVIQLDQATQALNNMLQKYAAALQAFNPQTGSKANRSWVKRRYTGKQLICISCIQLAGQTLAISNRLDQQQLQVEYQLLAINTAKQQHEQEINRLSAVIAEGKALLQHAQSHASTLDTALISSFSQKITSLEQEMLTQQMAIMQLGNSQAFALEMLQNKETFSDIQLSAWQQNLLLAGNDYQQHSLNRLYAEIKQHDERSTFAKVSGDAISICVKSGIAGLLFFFILYIILANNRDAQYHAQFVLAYKQLSNIMVNAYLLFCLYKVVSAIVTILFIHPRLGTLRSQLQKPLTDLYQEGLLPKPLVNIANNLASSWIAPAEPAPLKLKNDQ